MSFRSDLYALGCLLFEMLTGQPPFPGEDAKAVLEAHKNVAPPEISTEVELPTQAQTLLRALLAKDPRQRPFSAQQVRRTLEPLLPPGAPLPALQSRAPSSSGGISAPPAGAVPEGRGSRPGKSPRGDAPPVPGKAAAGKKGQFASGMPTEEIELEEIELRAGIPVRARCSCRSTRSKWSSRQWRAAVRPRCSSGRPTSRRSRCGSRPRRSRTLWLRSRKTTTKCSCRRRLHPCVRPRRVRRRRRFRSASIRRVRRLRQPPRSLRKRKWPRRLIRRRRGGRSTSTSSRCSPTT